MTLYVSLYINRIFGKKTEVGRNKNDLSAQRSIITSFSSYNQMGTLKFLKYFNSATFAMETLCPVGLSDTSPLDVSS